MTNRMGVMIHIIITRLGLLFYQDLPSISGIGNSIGKSLVAILLFYKDGGVESACPLSLLHVYVSKYSYL